LDSHFHRLRSVHGTGVLLCAALVAGLTGCSSIGGAAKLNTYDLTAPEKVKAGPRKAKVQVLVTEPTALKALDSENIVVREGAGQIQYLGGAQWGDRLPKIVQARLIEAFERSGRFGGIGRPGEGLAIDYQVITDIRAFGIQDGVAQIEIAAKLLNDGNGVVRGSKVFTASVKAGSGPDALVSALDQAFAKVASELVTWAGKSL
jgi:cholesterol transport system auxiliary component